MHKEAVAERPGRKVKIVDPTYNPRHEAEDTDEETTTTQIPSGKRKLADLLGQNPATKRVRTLRAPSPFPVLSSISEESIQGSRLLPVYNSPTHHVASIKTSDELLRDISKVGTRTGKSTLKSQKDESYTPSQAPKPRAPKSSLNRKRKGTDNGASDEEEEYIGSVDVSKSEKKTAYDFSLERARRWAAAVSLPGTWNRAEKELFFRLAMRGFEPLLPQHWRHDFSTLPETLFSSPKNGKVPVVWPFRELDFHGKLKMTVTLFFLAYFMIFRANKMFLDCSYQITWWSFRTRWSGPGLQRSAKQTRS